MKSSREKRRRGSATLVWVLAAFVLIFSIWAYNAPLDQIVRGNGALVPSSNNQIVQSLEGGILEEIVVREGDFVEAGQVIARLNETRYQADVTDFEGQILAIEVRLARLRAELDEAEEFSLPEEVWEADANIAESEERLFEARQFQYETAVSAAEDMVQLDTRELELVANMVERNAMPAIELLKAETAALDSQTELNRLIADYRLERADEISTLLAELSRLEAQIQQSRDQLDRSTLTSPADGVVNTIYTTTIGGVVQSGEPIFEITPQNDELLVEVRIRPEDIAFIATGMDATIKLTAYDYTVYGSLSGAVSQVSADTFEDEQSASSEPYYRVLVSVDPESLAEQEGVFEIRPGMLATTELHVGQRTVMQYLLTPLIKSSEALREP